MHPRSIEVLATLTQHGLLLKQDKRLPNVVTLVIHERLSSSWWEHPKGKLIFTVLSELFEHPDVLFTKLLYGKDTLVHRSMWHALLAVATGEEPWQKQNWPAAARNLFERVHREGKPVVANGTAVKDLVSRLLVHSVDVHTESGKHQTALEPWSRWAKRHQVLPMKSIGQARHTLENACQSLGAPLSALPWPMSKGAAR